MKLGLDKSKLEVMPYMFGAHVLWCVRNKYTKDILRISAIKRMCETWIERDGDILF